MVESKLPFFGRCSKSRGIATIRFLVKWLCTAHLPVPKVAALPSDLSPSREGDSAPTRPEKGHNLPKYVKGQAMRGRAQLIAGRPSLAALRAAWQGLFSPVHPDQEEPWPLVGSPAPERLKRPAKGRRVRPLETRVQGALLPETPAREGGHGPLPHHPRHRCRR